MAEEEKKDDALPAAKKGGGRGMILIVAIVAINLLAMVGIGAYLVLGSGEPAEAQEDEEEDDEEEDAAPALGEIVEFLPMIVNLRDSGSHYIKVSFNMELGPEVAASTVTDRMVPLRDGVLAFLSTLTVEDVQGPDRMTTVRQRLVEIANERLGPNSVAQIYFAEFLVQ